MKLKCCAACTVLLALSAQPLISQPPARAHVAGLPASHCKQIVFEGEVNAGQGFVRRLGQGLTWMLEPIASGWIIRVLPPGSRPAQDWAELATPPYRSMTPLAISTDFSFRAQDAIAWNPRHFQFLTDASVAKSAAAAYAAYMAHPDSPESSGAMGFLVGLPESSAQGDLLIEDSRLVPGTANQGQMAASVAMHFSTTPHTVEQPAGGHASPLGRVTWMRFRVTLLLPRDFTVDGRLSADPVGCR
jgi:hypothetical protein